MEEHGMFSVILLVVASTFLSINLQVILIIDQLIVVVSRRCCSVVFCFVLLSCWIIIIMIHGL